MNETPVQPFDRERVRRACVFLAEKGVYAGASSWKYPGWCGQLYDESRYAWRGKFAKTRFEKDCLREYAEVFKTVCLDAAYYAFPSIPYLEGLAAQVPDDFRFGLKVTDEITIKHFPNQPRFGARAGRPNEHFLNPDLFASGFLLPCEAIRSKVGIVMFEFSKFHRGDYAHGRDFVADLDRFLAELPKGWPYGVELRNSQWLRPDYFECLARHGVAHVFNSWQAMPPVSEQMSLPGSLTSLALAGARFLLKPGRSYEQAVKAFSPYQRIQEPNFDARRAALNLIRQGLEAPGRKTYIFINNRLEGNALQTITAIFEAIWGSEEVQLPLPPPAAG